MIRWPRRYWFSRRHIDCRRLHYAPEYWSATALKVIDYALVSSYGRLRLPLAGFDLRFILRH